MKDTMTRAFAALALVALASSTASAQQASSGPKWRALIGCWTPSVPGTTNLAPSDKALFVCVTPSTSGTDAVDIATITDGKVTATQQLDATGKETPITAKGCTGAQRVSWSADERRVYLTSGSVCDGLRSATSSILSITAGGEWIEVRGITSYGSTNVRVGRYRDAGVPSSIPAEIADALKGRGAISENARIAAGAPIGANAVIEASRIMDSTVIASWLLERDQRFSLDANTLVQMADAGVPGAVTDAVVAVSNPSAFAFARNTGDVTQANTIIADAPVTGRRVTAYIDPYDPWAWGYSRSRYGYGYNPYGYNAYGQGYGGNYGGGYYGGYSAPIIIVTSPNQPEAHGQVIKGRGYTQTGGSSNGTASGRQNTSSSGSTSSGTSSSGSAAPAPAPAPAQTEQRTAHPKP